MQVARGIWRKIRTGRSVPIDSQLRSHRLFSDNWSRLAHQVDMATLYHTGAFPFWLLLCPLFILLGGEKPKGCRCLARG